MKSVKIQIILLFVAVLSYGQRHYGFLKPGTAALHVKDIVYRQTGTGILSQKTYFEILNTDSSKYKIFAYCKYLHKSPDASVNYEGYTCFVDSSLIECFDCLEEKEKRQHISSTFDNFITVLKEKPFNLDKIEYTGESQYEPMRDEFVKYWLKTKDSALLRKWFVLLDLNGGSADEMESATAAQLFCSSPDDFCRVLKSSRKSLKNYVVYRLQNSGFVYYFSYIVKTNVIYDDSLNMYKDLLNKKLRQ